MMLVGKLSFVGLDKPEIFEQVHVGDGLLLIGKVDTDFLYI